MIRGGEGIPSCASSAGSPLADVSCNQTERAASSIGRPDHITRILK